MGRLITLGLSPCPNDTFSFDALLHGRIPQSDLRFSPVVEDVQMLNERARRGELDVSKVSYHAVGFLREHYVVLHSGSALGYGCGPLLVAPSRTTLEGLAGGTIAVPGSLTTGALLLRLAAPELPGNVRVMRYDRIVEAVRDGEVDGGVIIHESRFTYGAHGLSKIVDLGEWWEQETGSPIPLGGIVAKRELGGTLLRVLEQLIRESVEYAWAHPAESWPYVKENAQEPDDEVIRRHIGLYVNEFSRSLGREGEKAVENLMERAVAAGVFPGSSRNLFPE